MKYVKHRLSKYKFRTSLHHGRKSNGKTIEKGHIKKGETKAMEFLQKKLGRDLKIHRTRHTMGEWVFVEKAT